jgi:hypothetical protein
MLRWSRQSKLWKAGSRPRACSVLTTIHPAVAGSYSPTGTLEVYTKEINMSSKSGLHFIASICYLNYPNYGIPLIIGLDFPY